MQVQGIGSLNVRDFVKKVVVWNETKAGAVADRAVNAVVKFAVVNTLFTQRWAFLQLVKINFRGFATRLAQKSSEANKSWWQKIGGEWANFRDAIQEGKDKPYVFGIKKGEGARDEADMELLNNILVSYEKLNGEPLENAVFSTASGEIPLQAQYIGDAYAVAALVAAAGTVVALVLPYLNTKEETELQARIANGETLTEADYEKSFRLQATQAHIEEYNKQRADGKSEAEAIVEAAKVYAATMQKLRSQYNIKASAEKLAQDTAQANKPPVTQSSGSGFSFNLFHKDNLPLGIAMGLFLFRKPILKLFKTK